MECIVAAIVAILRYRIAPACNQNESNQVKNKINSEEIQEILKENLVKNKQRK